jgi:hypothetical protein
MNARQGEGIGLSAVSASRGTRTELAESLLATLVAVIDPVVEVVAHG